ncbi:MAG: PP2C family protein-serine/threonine phosphatase [Planctomycetota bacterium]
MGSWNDGLKCTALTDVGMRRRNNQDAHRVVLAPDEATWRERGHVLMVADGMGAHAAGELASKLAVDNVPHLYLKHRELSPPEALRKAIQEANSEVHRRGQANPDFHHMGTTTSVLVLLPEGAIAAHLGDSRIYRLRDNTFEQLTFDHSLVWEMRRDSDLPPGTDLSLLPKNVITRSLGPNPSVEVDLEGPFPLQPGDTFLLCSDGLTGQVPDEELASILRNLPPDEAPQVLVDLANLRGGPDNITVIVARVSQEDRTSSSGALTVEPGATAEIHPAIWVAAGVAGLASAALFIAQSWLWGTVSLILAVAIIGAGFINGWRTPWSQSIGGGGRLGKGPHAQVTCTPPTELLAKMARLAEDLQEAAKDKALTLTAFDQACERSRTAAKRGNLDEALRGYSRAITSAMREFRQASRKRSIDSALD